MPMPRSPEEVQALFESLVAAGQVPKEILERMQKGERFTIRVTPQGLVMQPAPDQPPAAASTPPPPAAGSPVTSSAPAPAPAMAGPAAAPNLGMRGAAAAGGKPATATRAANTPKPGRNDLCPCGSGIKYKKCCAPAFD
jgi:hypothetical protein